jgi:hypothetical protein
MEEGICKEVLEQTGMATQKNRSNLEQPLRPSRNFFVLKINNEGIAMSSKKPTTNKE